MIERLQTDRIRQRIVEGNKIVILYGPRQVGKTTLVKTLIGQLPYRSLSINADELRYIEVLSSRNLNQLKGLVSGYELLFIDEAQRVPDIGINLKILHDSIPELRIIVTGSSSFELANKTKEALTGRTWTYQLYPISVGELAQTKTPFVLREELADYLVTGMYPELFRLNNRTDKVSYLQELSAAYLYKDLLDLSNLKYADKLRRLLQLLAFQIGSEVSMSELGTILGMSKDTVSVYIDLLEKAFVVFRLSGFSRNLRKEVSKMDKIYFYDLGIRNVLIDNLLPIDRRNDLGPLWENFLISERIKRNQYAGMYARPYFWRTYTQAELDYVEEADGQIAGFEFKYSRSAARIPASWRETYPEATFKVINRDNFLDFIG